MTPNDALKWLEKNGSRRYKDGLVRYGIVAKKAFGVPVGTLLEFAREHGKDHALAAMIDAPRRVTRRQMNAWANDFDNWGVCDTVCWHLFDYTPFAWETLRKWSSCRCSR